MISIDGRQGEGGGQILRSSLSLAGITGQAVALSHIRGGRAKPGLMRQHLTAVKAAARVCAAQVEGAALGSQQLTFAGIISGGRYHFAIGSGGSACLGYKRCCRCCCGHPWRHGRGRRARITPRAGL